MRTCLSRTLAIVLVALLVGCATASPRHIATGGSTALADALIGVQQTADAAVTAGALTVAQRQALAVPLLPALQTARDINTAILNWAPGTPMPANIATLIGNLQAVTKDLLGAFTSPATQATENAYIAAATVALLSILAVAGQ